MTQPQIVTPNSDIPPAIVPTAQPVEWSLRLLRGLLVILLALGFFLGTYAFYLQNIDFPYGYHPDESTKTVQLTSNTRSFFHPLLLLESTKLIADWTHSPMTTPALLQLGRRVSVFYGAITVLSAALLGYAIGGIGGMLIVGLAVCQCPPVLVYAHYMKEDAGLVAGVAMFVLAAKLFCSARSWKTQLPAAIFVGVACAVATSGKYMGVAVCPVGLLVVLLARKWSFVWVPVFLAALVGMVMLINHRAVQDPAGFRAGFHKEADHATTDHAGITMTRPNRFFIREIGRETQVHVLLLAAAMAALAIWNWRTSRWELMAMLTAAVLLAVVSWSIIPFGRYVLPVIMLLYCFSGVGLVRLIQRIHDKWLPSGALYAIGVALVLGLQLPCTLQVSNQFANDSRTRLGQWLAQNTTPTTRIVRDPYTQAFNLPSVVHYAATSSGSPADLKKQGVKYVIVCELDYGRFLDPLVQASPRYPKLVQHCRDWYTDLFAHYPVVWESIPYPQTYSFTNPMIRVYQLN